MRHTGTCPKCASNQLLENTRVIDRGQSNSKRDLEVAVYKKPDALIFKGERRGVLKAWICTNCGYTELYCPDLF